MKYRIRIEDQTFDIEIENLNARPVVVSVDDGRSARRLEVWTEGELGAQPAVQTAQATAPAAGIRPAAASGVPGPLPAGLSTQIVRAPIPGVIVAIQVATGDEVAFGQELFIIEAMKMRNAIRASRAGVISRILVSQGQTVNHSEPLLEFTE